MPKQTQSVDFIFDKGIRTDTDPKLQIDTHLLDLQNGLFDKYGAINKRNGFEALSRDYYNTFATSTSGTLSSGMALAKVNDELVMLDGNHLLSWAPSANKWIGRGEITPIIPTAYQVVANNHQQICAGVAYDDGVEIHVREDSSNNEVRYTIVDSETHTHIVADTPVKKIKNLQQPQVFSLGNYFVVTYHDADANDVSYTTLDKSNLTAEFSTPVDLNTNSNGAYDAVLSNDGTQLWFAYQTTNAIGIRYLDANLNLSAEQTIAAGGTAVVVSLCVDDSGRCWVFWRNSGGTPTVTYAIRSSTNTQVLAPTNITTSATNPYRIVATVDGSQATVFIEESISPSWKTYINSCTCTVAGSVGTVGGYLYNVGLVSKIFTHNSKKYMVIAHESEYQATYFLHDLAAFDTSNQSGVIAKLLPGVAGGLEARPVAPTIVSKGNGKFIFPCTRKVRAQSGTGVFFSLLSAAAVELDFAPTNPFSTCELGNTLIIAGGQIWRYDGAHRVEHGFHFFPEHISASVSNTANGAIANGTYRYKVVYSYIDNQGNIERSAPSDGYTVNIGGTNDTITLGVQCNTLVSREQPVLIDIYRTTNGGSIYYKLTGPGDELYNDIGASTVFYVDEYADSEIIGNEPLYSLGEVENTSPPSAKICTVWKNRVWLAGLENPYELWFSKLHVTGRAPEFNGAYTFRVTPVGGTIKDLAAQKEFLIIFKESAIYALYGNGPNNQGGMSDYGDLQVISTDLGAKFTGCTVEIPDGIMFVSNKGIYLIDRNGVPIHIGKPVDAYKDLNYVSAGTIPDKNLAVFATSDGYFLVYDWVMQQWSRWTGLENAKDLLIWNDALLYLNSEGYVNQYGSGYTDNGTAYQLVVETGNFAPTGRSGYCQVDNIAIFGDYKSDHDLKVEFYRNNASDNPRTFTVDVSAIRSGGDEEYEYQWRNMGEKVKAFRLKIYDHNPVGESMSLSGMRLEVAGLPGANRVGNKRQSA